MSAQQLNLLAPLATSAPDLPADQALTPEQWETLLAVAETMIPQIRPAVGTPAKAQLCLPDSEYQELVEELRRSVESPPDHSAITRYLSESPTSYELFGHELNRTLSVKLRDDARKGIRFILNAQNTRLGSLVMNGSVVPFKDHSFEDRSNILRKWSQSYVPALRQTFHSLSRLFLNIWAATGPDVGPALGFPRNPVHGKPAKGFDFKFMQFSPASEPKVLETDVIIVGSGCGAAVAAKNLAEGGHRVLTVDKGYYHPAEYLPMSELHGPLLLFEGGGSQPSDDGSVMIMAGSTWGGGGTVNWSASLQTQAFVREEWAGRGLNFFTSAEFQTCLDRVCHRMGASTDHIEHNHGNQVILEGARRLGYSAKAVPQNTGGNKHFCGYCTFGCGSAEKQGPVVSWLPDAARAGAQFIQGYTVNQVLFEDRSGTKSAVGTKGVWKSKDGSEEREVVVRAKKVIVSAGTLWSPVILLNSGLKNPQIGQNLKLHPASFVCGLWKEEIRPWEGGILTSVCDEFEDLDGHGHGVKLECTVMLPSWVLPTLPGFGLDLKKLAFRLKHMNAFVSIVRDKASGRVYRDAAGRPGFAYTPSNIDKAHAMEGMIAMAKMCYVTGAEEIYVMNGAPPYIRSKAEDNPTEEDKVEEKSGINNPHFQAWLATVRAGGIHNPETFLGTAHQMGTCRMGVSEKDSVVNQNGKVWGTENLYVADASVFPSASGVNPMVTNMAISDWISRGIDRQLRSEAKRGNENRGL